MSILNVNKREKLPVSETALFGHPRGLTVLCLTDMWAYFSYFGLSTLLVYYMTQQLGFSQTKSSLIFGLYGGAAFFTPFFGGIIADRWFGRTPSVILGGVLMMCGHFMMAVETLFFGGLALVALGNGLFTPTLAVQVGSLYKADDPRKEHAYSAYYMGINLGALLAPLVCGTLGERFGWHWGFGAAGIGMLIGLLVYLCFAKYLPKEPSVIKNTSNKSFSPLSKIEWGNLRLLAAIIATVILFRIGYEQSGNVIALWIENKTDRNISIFGRGMEIPATWFQSINPLVIITLTPFVIRIWAKRAKKNGPANLLWRMSGGCAIATLAMLFMVGAALVNSHTEEAVSAWWVIGYFMCLTFGELMIIPIGLTIIGALSPLKYATMLMGAWYLAKFLGSILAGIMGTLWGVISPVSFFGIGVVTAFSATLIFLAIGKWWPVKIE